MYVDFTGVPVTQGQTETLQVTISDAGGVLDDASRDVQIDGRLVILWSLLISQMI